MVRTRSFLPDTRDIICKCRKWYFLFLKQLHPIVRDEAVSLKITGSVGMGLCERYHFPFVQEVVAATKAIRSDYPSVGTLIDIGGEDAKIVFVKNGTATDLRMNGNRMWRILY